MVRVLMEKFRTGGTNDSQSAGIKPPTNPQTQKLNQQSLGMQINTSNVTGLHPLVFGDFGQLWGNVAGLRGCVTGLRGNANNIFGDVTYLPRLNRGDISQAVDLCTRKFAKNLG